MNLSDISGLGKITKEIEPLKDIKIIAHSLSVKEEEEIYEELSKCKDDALVKTTALQIETLSRSIESINGQKFFEVKVIREYLKGIQRHLLTGIWLTWVKEIEEPSLTTITDLKKNSEPPKAA